MAQPHQGGAPVGEAEAEVSSLALRVERSFHDGLVKHVNGLLVLANLKYSYCTRLFKLFNIYLKVVISQVPVSPAVSFTFPIVWLGIVRHEFLAIKF